jgi:hypothetical protein
MTTLFHMSVEKSRKRPAELPPEARPLDVLRSRLPPDAVALAVAEWPGIADDKCAAGKHVTGHRMNDRPFNRPRTARRRQRRQEAIHGEAER